MENEVDVTILPRTLDLVFWLVSLVPVIILLLWDVWKAWQRWAPWIPGQTFVLNPLIIRLLSYIDYLRISVYSGSRSQTVKVKAILVKSKKVIDSGRLMLCVLIAYLIPGMARSSSITDGINLAALAWSIAFHVVSEFRSDWKVEKRNESLSALASYLNHYIFAIILIAAIIYLLLLLIHAVMIGSAIRRFTSQKIRSAISCCTPYDARCSDINTLRYNYINTPRCNDIKDHVLKCWIVARLCQPDYVLSRSRLCSTVGPTVTTCFVFYILNIIINILDWIFIDNDPLNSVTKGTLVQLVITGQIVIVVIGWIVLLVRWVTSDGQGNISGEYDFYGMSLQDLKSELEARFIGLFVRDKRIQEKRIRDMNKKFRDIQSLLWYPWHWVQTHFQIFPIQNPIAVVDPFQFPRYNETLSMLLIPGESARSLWKANQWAFTKVERYMDHDDGKRSPSELIFLLRLEKVIFAKERKSPMLERGITGKERKARFLEANKNSWKMTAVSLIHLMIYSYNDSDVSAIEDASVIENAMQCYIQGWEYMDFVDGLNEEVKSLGRQADGEFDSLQHSWNKRAQPGMLETEIKEPLRQLTDQLQRLSYENRRNLQNSWDSTEVAKYCLFETWRCIDDYLYAPEINKINRLQRVLAYVYFLYMTEDVNNAVLQMCHELAEEGMEEEILHVAFLAAKAKGVLDKVREENNLENPHNTGQASTSSTIPTENEPVGEGNGQAEATAKLIRDRLAHAVNTTLTKLKLKLQWWSKETTQTQIELGEEEDDSTGSDRGRLNGRRQRENPLKVIGNDDKGKAIDNV